MKQQREGYTAEKRSTKLLTFLCYVFLVIWLVACTSLIIFVILYKPSVPQGAIMPWIPGETPPEGERHLLKVRDTSEGES